MNNCHVAFSSMMVYCLSLELNYVISHNVMHRTVEMCFGWAESTKFISEPLQSTPNIQVKRYLLHDSGVFQTQADTEEGKYVLRCQTPCHTLPRDEGGIGATCKHYHPDPCLQVSSSEVLLVQKYSNLQNVIPEELTHADFHNRDILFTFKFYFDFSITK